MNLMPLVGFYWKHGPRINTLMAANSGAGQSSLLLDVVTAMAPIVKKHWPQLNTDGLIDDGLATVKEVLGPPAA